MASFADRYLRTRTPPAQSEIALAIWTADPNPVYERDHATYGTALLEQYKTYVEMADRVSSRRGAANSFFLALNTMIATALGVFWQRPPQASPGLAAVPLGALIGQCLAWFWIVRSYRQLNVVKYAVIGALEQRLPASPYWKAEWAALGEGKNPARYWPLSHVEQWVPLFFAMIYISGLVTLLIT